MTKYSFEFKLKIVQAYLSSEGGYRYLSKKYGIGSASQVVKWIKIYEHFGEGGLFRKQKIKLILFKRS